MSTKAKKVEEANHLVAKCSVQDGKYVVPCTPLDKATEYGNPRGKQRGVWEWRLYHIDMNAKSMDMDSPSRSFFGIKSGEYTERGLAFHFCPFCGVDISAPLEKRK
jgi:hypothetical protein